MSAGTMLCCISKEIIMGKHSSIGPIDPQMRGIPAYSIIEEAEKAKQEILVNPSSTNYWAVMLNKYPASFVIQCEKAINLSSELASFWLNTGDMFINDNKEVKEEKVSRIVNYLNNYKDRKVHARHITPKQAIDIGLNVNLLESDTRFQEAILSVHHSYMHTFEISEINKIIENQDGKSYIL